MASYNPNAGNPEAAYGYGYGRGGGQQPPPNVPPPYMYPLTSRPPQTDGPPPPNGDEKLPFEQAFAIQQPKYNDLWAGALLLLVFAGFAVVSGISINGYVLNKNVAGGTSNNNGAGVNEKTFVLFALCLAVAAVFSFAYISLARIFPKQFIWATGILNIVAGLVTAIFMIQRKQFVGGIIFLVFVVFLIFAFITWIPRIPFSALMLKTSIDVSKRYGHVYLLSFLGGLLATALGAWYMVTFVAVYIRFEPGNKPTCNQFTGACSSGKVTGLIVFITFAMFWISEWIKGTIHTAIGGVYGSWYFHPHNLPRGATRGALMRSLTYSFGSISLGSLVVAIISFLRYLFASVRDNVPFIVYCIVDCLVGLLEWAAEFINRYAFSYIALYGKGYIPAAKATWSMIKQRGIDVLINDCLISPVLSMGALFVGYLTALTAFIYLQVTHPAANSEEKNTILLTAFGFLIGLQICNIFTTPIAAGIDTLFVAMAWEPQVLMYEHPELYADMVHVYPKVQEAIHA